MTILGELIYFFILSSKYTSGNILTLPLRVSPSIAQITQKPSVNNPVAKLDFLHEYLSLCPQNNLCKKGIFNMNLEGEIQSIEKFPKNPNIVEFKFYQNNNELSEGYRKVYIDSTKAEVKGNEGQELNIDQLKIGDKINIYIEYDYLKKKFNYIINVLTL